MQTAISTGQYLKDIGQALDGIAHAAVDEFVALLIETAHRGHTIFLVGNGGSAATASHFACDLAKGTRSAHVPYLRVIALTDNIPVITAWANDVAYEEVFAEQLRGLCQPQDLLIAISASGMSPNILRAATVAHTIGAKIVALTGQGGQLGPLADIWLCTPAQCIEQIEDLHLILTHLVACQVRTHAS